MEVNEPINNVFSPDRSSNCNRSGKLSLGLTQKYKSEFPSGKSDQVMTSKSIIFRADLFFIALIMVMNYLTIEMNLISKKKVSAFVTFFPRKGAPKRFSHLMIDEFLTPPKLANLDHSTRT